MLDAPKEIPEEFFDSKPIEKLHRYAVTTDGKSIYFGLRGNDESMQYFVADIDNLSLLATEIGELLRFARHVERGSQSDEFFLSDIPDVTPHEEMGIVPPFDGSKLKILRATIHFENLQELVSRYFRQADFQAVEVGSEGDEVLWEMRFNPPPPAAIALVIGDIVHNLRSALDLMVCDLARIQRLGTDNLKFPFAENAKKLENILKDYGHLGKGVVDAIRLLKPYKGDDGNKLLRGCTT